MCVDKDTGIIVHGLNAIDQRLIKFIKEMRVQCKYIIHFQILRMPMIQ
jgi:hypothetical protein